jgi:hypothetical protein
MKLPALVAVMSLAATLASAGHPLQEWHWKNPRPQGNPLYTLIFENDLFLAAGYGGTILTSSNGLDWDQKFSGAEETLAAATFGRDKYVVGGENGIILYSTNLLDWIRVESGVNGTFVGMAYADNEFFAITSNGWLARSPDAITWTNGLLSSSAGFTDMAYGNGTLTLCAESPRSSGKVWTLTNRTNWTETSFFYQLWGLTYGDGRFVVVGPHSVFVSTNGVDWEGVQGFEFPDVLFDVVYGPNGYVASGYVESFGSPTAFHSSVDGRTWQRTYPATSYKFRRIAYGTGSYVAVGDFGGILTSSDGHNWSMRYAGPTNSLQAATYGNRNFVAVGDAGAIVRSPDGINWLSQTSSLTSATLSGVAYGNGRFVAVSRQGLSSGGKILCSSNAINWDVLDSGTNVALWGVTFASGSFLAAGDKGVILSSENGTAWDIHSAGANQPFIDITYGNNMYVAVGGALAGASVAAYSTDKVHWISQQVSSGGPLRSVAYGNGMFVAVGYLNLVMFSTNGVNWSNVIYSPPYIHYFQTVAFGDGRFVAMGFEPGGERRNFLYTSTNGINWTLLQERFPYPKIQDVTFQSGYFLAFGDHGTILQSAYAGIPRLSIRTFGDDPVAQICIKSQRGWSYRLEYTSDVVNGPWETEAYVTDAPEEMSIIPTPAVNNTGRFFRVASP